MSLEDDADSVSSLTSLISVDGEISPEDTKCQRRILIDRLKSNTKCRRCSEILYSLERKHKVKHQTISNHLRIVHDRKPKPNSSQTTRYALVNTKEQQPTPTLIDDQVITDQPSVMVEPPKIDGDGITLSIDQSDKFITPLKTVKWSNAFDESPAATQTSNFFEPLQTDDVPIQTQMDIENSASPTEKEIRNKAQQTPSKKNEKPPPIILPGHLKSHAELISNIKALVKRKFSLKYAKKSVIIYCDCPIDWSNLKRNLLNEKREFHTYASTNERTHAFVLRGLLGNISPEDVKENLEEEYNIKAKEIFTMKGTYKPLYLVVLDSSYNLSKLQNQAKYVLNVKVSWETRKNQRDMAQCRRCQTWGHVARNCHRSTKCSKCAGNHEITQCNEENTVKCANCSGPHRSFDTSCPVYEYRMNIRNNKKPPPPQPSRKYIDAPQPTQPAWTQQQATQSQPLADINNRAHYDSHFPDKLNKRQNSSGESDAHQSKFLTLKSKFEELESLINIDNLINALTHYTTVLRNCKSPEEKFVASQKFFSSELKNFNI